MSESITSGGTISPTNDEFADIGVPSGISTVGDDERWGLESDQYPAKES